MKFTSIVAAGLAAVATAAPAKVERSAFDFGNGVQNFDIFGNQDLAYLGIVNQLNFDVLSSLALNNNLNLDVFGGLFNNNAAFDLQNLLLLQQLIDIQNFANVGLLGAFDLGGLGFNSLNFGVTGLDVLGLNQFIPQNVFGNIQQVVSQQVTTFVAKE